MECPFENFTALGDSYAAGINSGIELPICNGSNGNITGPYCTTKQCAKMEGSCSWQFHDNYKPEKYAFLACSGANTTHALQKQLLSIPSGTDLVTINIGGNNNDMFSSVITRCVFLPGQFGCNNALKNAANTIAAIVPTLTAVIREIKFKIGNAKVVVLGYVAFWPVADVTTQCQSNSLRRPSALQKATMNKLVRDMNSALLVAANAIGAQFVNVDPDFEDHRLCDVETPYIQWDLEGRPGFEDGNNDDTNDPKLDLFNLGVFHADGQG